MLIFYEDDLKDLAKEKRAEAAKKAKKPTVSLKPIFEEASGHIEGHLYPIAETKVNALRSKYYSDLKDKVSAVIPESAAPERHLALYDYAIALCRTRQKVTAKKLEELASESADDIRTKSAEILQQITDLESSVGLHLCSIFKKSANIFVSALTLPFKLPFMLASMALGGAPKSDIFSGERVYFSFKDNSVSAVRPYVEAFLAKHGFEITDYEGGYATDDGGKNIKKINKVISSLDDVPGGLQDAFVNDPCRIQKKLMVVMTSDPVDLARGSFARGWKSCRANPERAAKTGVSEHKAGVVAAYLVTEDDPDIHDPIGRVYLKPYDSRFGAKTVYFTFNPIGLHVPAFVNAVNNFADEVLNKRKYGKFHLRSGCEAYREMHKRTRLPDKASSALRRLKVKFRREDGKLVVDGNLDLSNRGLHKLPDLRNVVVKGGIDVSDNKLLTLEGLPQSPVAWIKAQGTLISSFVGCTPKVNGNFAYPWSAYLESAAGAPEAKSYSYGGGYNQNARDTANAPICPIDHPSSFPRFKRS